MIAKIAGVLEFYPNEIPTLPEPYGKRTAELVWRVGLVAAMVGCILSSARSKIANPSEP